MFNKVALILTPLLLLGIALERLTFLTPEDAGLYHATVGTAMDAVPNRFGPWEGTDIKVPEAAQQLLRPNRIISRQYRRADPPAAATLILIQCGDTRDLIGHYPPVCYPANGWTPEGESDVEVEVAGEPTPLRRYQFRRSSLGRDSSLVVYSFFVIPGRGRVRGMDAVGAAASDYSRRHFGAAQIQVVLGEALSEAEEVDRVGVLLSAAADAIRALEAVGGSGVR
ncbi:MAG: exosortase-associated EpsI family protein [Phycisphaerales bacterium]